MERIRFLTLVKAYPAISRQYGEVSCVAGLRLDAPSTRPEWIRLYPVPFRSLGDEKRFKKYEVIELEVQPHSGDRRPESRRPNVDSIRTTGVVLGSDDGWRDRRPIVEPLIRGSMCELLREQQARGTSLGIFRPREINELRIEERDVDESKALAAKAWASQLPLLADSDEKRALLRALEQIPYSFKYRYLCDDPNCPGHIQSIVDWEIMQMYRKIRKRPDWQDLLRDKWLGELCGPSKDTALIVGNQHRGPQAFLVLGVWWPPRQPPQLTLA